MKLSLAMIVRDNESVLGQTLESIQSFVDEIIIVDTGSLDNTKAVAESYGAKVYDFEWIDDFAAARNFSFEKATNDWVMWLDSGDIVPPNSAKIIISEFKNNPFFNNPNTDAEGAMFRMNRLITDEGEVISWYMICRIARKSAGAKWVEPIHETLATDNNRFYGIDTAYVNDPLAIHQGVSDRNLNILLRLRAQEEVSTRTHYYLGQELVAHQRLDEAIPEFLSVLEKQDYTYQRYVSLMNLAMIYFAKQDFGKYVEYLLQAAFFDSSKPDAFINLGDVFFNNNDWLKAMPFYKATIGMKPISDGSQANEHFYGYYPHGKLGFCYLGLGDNKQALYHFKEAARTSAGEIKDKYMKLVRDFTLERKNKKK